ncbi:MAG: hypothetical protein OXE92_11075 [Bacteroidetes bacterium]|nr:hypothetical protein [Bacteroidota bacterium]MCY4206254.1 hypothetical protein [Bacteroidota bacterium]
MRKIYDFQVSIDRMPLAEIDLHPNSLEGFRAVLLDDRTRKAFIALLA